MKICIVCGREFIAQRIQRQKGDYLAIVQTKQRRCDDCKKNQIQARKQWAYYQRKWRKQHKEQVP